MAQLPPAAWYPDPEGGPGMRYWDGQRWTEHRTAPVPAPYPAVPPGPEPTLGFMGPPQRRPSWPMRHKFLSAVIAVLLAFTGLGILGALVEDPQDTIPTAAEEAPTTTEPTPTESESPSEAPSESPSAKPVKTYRVVKVVDGDTIDLANGEAVRLIGMDSPEVGECGHEKATANLERLILGKNVVLTKARGENRDRYDRLLRYVDVDGKDAGLSQIRKGLAIARYDSRDGYGTHPREAKYIKADKRSANIKCAKPQPLVGQPPAANCEPGYSPCVPLYPPDVNCDDVNGPITVTGRDPHELDADGDGVACEP